MKRSGLTSVLVIGLALAAVGSFATPVAVAQDAPKQAKAKAGPKTAAAIKMLRIQSISQLSPKTWPRRFIARWALIPTCNCPMLKGGPSRSLMAAAC